MLLQISIVLCFVTQLYSQKIRDTDFVFPVEENYFNTSVDEFCRRRSDGYPGICTEISSCSSFQSSTPNPADICSITPQNEVIVCCRNETETSDRITTRKSVQKCEEYKQFVERDKIIELPPGFYGIIGGELVEPNEFPHMAVLGWTQSNGQVNWDCGGSLISEDFIMTAAHCIRHSSRPDVVRINDKNLRTTNDSASPEEYGIAEFIIHPDYKASSVYNDIALVRLNTTIKIYKKLRPACLWPINSMNFTKAIATGWGRLEFSGDKSDELLKVNVNIYNQDVCEENYPPSRRIRNGVISSQLCAGDLAGGKDTCQGDSGGPLQTRVRHLSHYAYYIIGITSVGKPCGSPETASIYTRVSSFIDWIETVVWP